MAGERVVLVGDTGGRIRSFVSALERFPDSPPWVVVGGFAVNVRISQLHRLTNDLDTISAQQSELVEILLAQPGADRLDHAKLRFTGETPAVDIDVMDDTTGHPLSGDPGDRAFALARRYAMKTRQQLAIVVSEGAEVSTEVTAPVASVAALVALKSVSMPRRVASNHPEKVASDAHDLVRLVEGRDLDELARLLTATGPELATWIGQTLVQWFSGDADQRYTLMRLRRLSSALDAQSVDVHRAVEHRRHTRSSRAGRPSVGQRTRGQGREECVGWDGMTREVAARERYGYSRTQRTVDCAATKRL